MWLIKENWLENLLRNSLRPLISKWVYDEVLRTNEKYIKREKEAIIDSAKNKVQYEIENQYNARWRALEKFLGMNYIPAKNWDDESYYQDVRYIQADKLKDDKNE